MARTGRKKSKSSSSSSGSSTSTVSSVSIPNSYIGDPAATAAQIAAASSKPSLIGARWERRSAKRDARQGINATNNVYDAFGNNISRYGKRTNKILGQIPGAYAQDVSGLSSLLGAAGPVGEMAATGEAFGGNYTANMGYLRDVQASAADFNQSVAAQGEVDRVNVIQSYQDDLQERLAEIANYVRQVRAQEGATTATLTSELQSRKFQEELAAAQMELQKAQILGQEGLAAALMEYIADLNAHGGGGGGATDRQIQRVSGGYDRDGNPVVGSADSGHGLNQQYNQGVSNALAGSGGYREPAARAAVPTSNSQTFPSSWGVPQPSPGMSPPSSTNPFVGSNIAPTATAYTPMDTMTLERLLVDPTTPAPEKLKIETELMWRRSRGQ